MCNDTASKDTNISECLKEMGGGDEPIPSRASPPPSHGKIEMVWGSICTEVVFQKKNMLKRLD